MTVDYLVIDVIGFIDRMEEQFKMMVPLTYMYDIRYKMIHSYKDYFIQQYGGLR